MGFPFPLPTAPRPILHRKVTDDELLNLARLGLSIPEIAVRLGMGWRMLTEESSGSPQGISYGLYAAGDLLPRSSLLNVTGEEGNGAGNYDGESEPNDTFKRPIKTVLLPHGDQ